MIHILPLCRPSSCFSPPCQSAAAQKLISSAGVNRAGRGLTSPRSTWALLPMLPCHGSLTIHVICNNVFPEKNVFSYCNQLMQSGAVLSGDDTSDGWRRMMFDTTWASFDPMLRCSPRHSQNLKRIYQGFPWTHVETCFRLLIQSVIIFHFVPLLTKSERLQLWVESTHGALRHAVWLNMCWTLLKLTASSRLIRRRREATCGKHRTAEIPCCKWLTVILKFISGWPPQSWGLQRGSKVL